MTYLPRTISLIIEAKVALDRVTKYLIAEDIHLDYVKTQEKGESETAIKVEKGNFYWLTEAEKELKKEKEKEENENGEKGGKKSKKKAKEIKNKEKKAKKGKEKNKKQVNEPKENTTVQKVPQSVTSDTLSYVISSQDNEIQANLKATSPILPISPTDLEDQKESDSAYKLTLKNINLDIKKGSFVAILGE